MSIQVRTVPDADAEGFLSLQRIRRVARSTTEEIFVATYPMPALLVEDVEVGAEKGDPKATVNAGPQLVTMMRSGRSAFRYTDEVGFLVKRPGNPFPRFVSVGRAANNDLVMAVDTVSKLHGYFTTRGDRWFLTDSGSTNGTKVNGETLETKSERELRSGNRILWGTQITTVFLTPQALFERARG